jgi:phosphatidylglycerol:prolipoprotein diacylglycerol transferase
MIGAIPYPSWIRPEIIPGFPYLRWYGLMYLVAFAISYILFKVQVKERGLEIDQDEIFSFYFWGVIGLLVGARLFAVTIWDTSGYFFKHPLQAILPFSWVGGKCSFTGFQGMSYHGGLVGAVVAIFIYCRVKKIDILDWGDMLLAGIPLGYTFGRLGNFINGELYGRVTTLPWAVVFPNAERIRTSEPWVKDFADRIGMDISGMDQVNLPRHPSQLYEAFFEGIFLWLILWFVFRKRRPFRGFIVASYVIGYGLLRFIIEYTRQPDSANPFPIRLGAVENPACLFVTPWNFTLGQVLCFLMILAGIICLIVFWKISKTKRRREQAATTHPSLKKLRKKIK